MYWQLSLLGLFLIIFILVKVRKKLFSEVKSILWVLGGIIIAVLPFFPGIIVSLSRFMGIDYPPSFLFLISIFFVLIILFRQEQDVSVLNEKVKDLAQKNAILELEIRRITKNRP